MFKKTGFLFAWGIFIVPQIFLFLIVSYLQILNPAAFRRLLAFPGTWAVFLTFQVLFVFYWRKSVSPVLRWRNGDEGTDEKAVNRAIIGVPKKVLIYGLLWGILFPQLVLAFYVKIPLSVRVDSSLIGFACTMFMGIPFYIPFIQVFEKWCSDVPFHDEYMSMKLSVRTNLVVSFLMASIVMFLGLGIKYFLQNAIFLEEVQSSLGKRLLPLELLGVGMSVFSIWQLMRGINRRIGLCHSFAGVLSSGDFSQADSSCLSRDELGALYNRLYNVYENNAALLKQLDKSVSRTMESKDAMITVSDDASASVEQISRNIDSVGSRMEELNRTIRETTESAGALKVNLDRLNSGVEEQSEMVESSSGAITEISASIDSISTVAQEKIRSAESLVQVSEDGKEKLDLTVEKINRINDSAENIREILSLIQNIAARTNLLAMNAAIEAAHAGDSGRGFAVVADEIRKLAESSTVSSREINDNVGDIISAIQETSEAGGDAITSFSRIAREIDGMINSYREISAGLSELRQGSGQILDSVTSLQSSSRRVSDHSSEMAALTGQVDSSMKDIERISLETSRAAEEMRNGSEEVLEVCRKMRDQSRVLDETSGVLVSGLGKFRF